MAFTIGRLSVDSPESFTEQVGDPTANVGGAIVPAQRTGLQAQASIPTFDSPLSSDSLATRMANRRQLRAMLNNTPYKLSGLYIAWDDDTEQNGWYIPGQGTIAAGADAPLVHGYFKIDGVNWGLVGHQRTHRRALGVYAKDRRLSTTPRDTLRQVYSVDFAALPSLTLVWLPSGSSDLINAVTGGIINTGSAQPAGEDGGIAVPVSGLADLTVVSMEQSEANRNKGDVVIYDRRGLGVTSHPSGGPDPAWEEVYGPDYPLTAGDVPVLDNGRVRVRLNTTGGIVFPIDVWTAGAWVDNGTVFPQRVTSGTGHNLDVLVSAAVLEYTPDRAVLKVVARYSGDGTSRETVIITLQRGWSGPRFEIYPSPLANGNPADGSVGFESAFGDANQSLLKIEAATVAFDSRTTGFAGGTFGASTFNGENWIALLRQAAAPAYSPTFSVVQSGLQAFTTSDANYGYGSRNAFTVAGLTGKGYVSAQLGFYLQDVNQTIEAEAMTIASGTSAITDAAASNGNTTQSTRVVDAVHVSRSPLGASFTGNRCRVLARVKTSAGTMSIYAKTNAQTGATKTTTSTSYVWIDLGDILFDGGIFEIHAWASSGTPNVNVDRIEAFRLEARGASGGSFLFDGARDQGQAALTDSRQIPTVTTR
jgi:hypothetical protein